MYDDLFQPKKFCSMVIAVIVLLLVMFCLPTSIEKLLTFFG